MAASGYCPFAEHCYWPHCEATGFVVYSAKPLARNGPVSEAESPASCAVHGAERIDLAVQRSGSSQESRIDKSAWECGSVGGDRDAPHANNSCRSPHVYIQTSDPSSPCGPSCVCAARRPLARRRSPWSLPYRPVPFACSRVADRTRLRSQQQMSYRVTDAENS